MSFENKIRRWRRASACAVLCLAISGFAGAQSDATPPAATAPVKKATAGSGSSATPHSSTANPSSKTANKSTQKTSMGKPSTHTTPHSATHSTASRSKSSRSKHGSKTVASKKRGQKAIDSDRTREIQTALIREHYLSGEPTGVWDGATQAAMQRYQTDQGWQSKTIPDSRALIKLGLGPNQDHLLNPESAMTTAPAATLADPKPPVKPAAPADGVPQK